MKGDRLHSALLKPPLKTRFFNTNPFQYGVTCMISINGNLFSAFLLSALWLSNDFVRLIMLFFYNHIGTYLRTQYLQ